MSATTHTHAQAISSSLELRELLENGAPASQIEAHLDALSYADRLAQVLAVKGSAVGALYDAMADAPVVTLEEMIAADEKGTVIHEGRNSLPTFSRFQKRLARAEGGKIVGYNHQSMSFVTGPGYFVVKAASGSGPVPNEPYFDYTEPPTVQPLGWPKPAPNERGLSRLVYANMKDYMRRVARGVMVGRAFKNDRPENAYFSLTREV